MKIWIHTPFEVPRGILKEKLRTAIGDTLVAIPELGIKAPNHIQYAFTGEDEVDTTRRTSVEVNVFDKKEDVVDISKVQNNIGPAIAEAIREVIPGTKTAYLVHLLSPQTTVGGLS